MKIDCHFKAFITNYKINNGDDDDDADKLQQQEVIKDIIVVISTFPPHFLFHLSHF